MHSIGTEKASPGNLLFFLNPDKVIFFFLPQKTIMLSVIHSFNKYSSHIICSLIHPFLRPALGNGRVLGTETAGPQQWEMLRAAARGIHTITAFLSPHCRLLGADSQRKEQFCAVRHPSKGTRRLRLIGGGEDKRIQGGIILFCKV